MTYDHLIAVDGEVYLSENDLREALGIVDEHVDILGVIKKLREENDTKIAGLKADLELTNRLYKENCDFVDKVCEAVDIRRPYLESGYDKAVELIAEIKRERDQLKEKYDKLKKRTNTAYGVSCGYSGNKAPAFHCNVISYNWHFGALDEPFNSIRVELDITPTANYKGILDMEDLKKYIQEYGREKKLSDFEIFCKLVDDCIDKLCDNYNVVPPDLNKTTRERLDYIFAVLADYRGMHDTEWNQVEELRAKIREIYRSVVDDEWDEHLSYTSALNDINEEYKRAVHNFEERTADWGKAQQELDRYRLAVGSLLGIPKEARDDINAIEKSFNYTKKAYESLQEFRNDVCEIFDIPRAMTHKQILKEIHDIAERYDELEDFRVDICGALDIESMMGTPKQNDKYILEQVVKLRDEENALHDLAMELDRKRIALTAKNSDLQQKFEFQSGLRQQWHSRYESEHERANGVQKCLDKTREALRVKDISLETARKEYEKVCGNLETAECALNGMKSKVHELREENDRLNKDLATLTGDTSDSLRKAYE